MFKARGIALAALLAMAMVGCSEADSQRASANDNAGTVEAPEARRGLGGYGRADHENLEYKPSLRPQAITVATVNGTAADKEDFEQAMVVCDVGTLGGTAPTLNVSVQEADTSGGSYTAITGAAFTQFTAARSGGVYHGSLTLAQRKQFLRLVGIGAGTGPTGSFACGLVFGNPKSLPTSLSVAADFYVRP